MMNFNSRALGASDGFHSDILQLQPLQRSPSHSNSRRGSKNSRTQHPQGRAELIQDFANSELKEKEINIKRRQQSNQGLGGRLSLLQRQKDKRGEYATQQKEGTPSPDRELRYFATNAGNGTATDKVLLN